MGIAGSTEEIWQKLADGGLVVLMRHASSNDGKVTSAPLVRDPSCQQERNLTAKGKKDAALIGKMFADKRVPVGEVLASPYCRTTDTAKIAFGRSTAADYLTVLEVLSAEQADRATEQLSRRIGSYAGRKNLVLVTHGPNIEAVSFDPVAQGAFVVFRPMGKDTFEAIGIINIVN